MKTTYASSSNNQPFLEETFSARLPQAMDVPKVNATDNNSYQQIKHKGRKRTLKNIVENEVIVKDEDIFEEDIAPKKQRKSEKRPDLSIRLNYSLGHFPYIDKSKLVRCKNSECDKKTYTFCDVCKVHLCINVVENRNCFTDFHKISKDLYPSTV